MERSPRPTRKFAFRVFKYMLGFFFIVGVVVITLLFLPINLESLFDSKLVFWGLVLYGFVMNYIFDKILDKHLFRFPVAEILDYQKGQENVYTRYSYKDQNGRRVFGNITAEAPSSEVEKIIQNKKKKL